MSCLKTFTMVAVEHDTYDDNESDVTLCLSAVYDLLCMKLDMMNEYTNKLLTVDS